MPELPEIELYLDALRPRIVDRVLTKVRIRSPSLLRSWDPPVAQVEGARVTAVCRLGKRVVWAMEEDLFVVIHLMISGRFRWRPLGTPIPAKVGLGAFDFPSGTLLLTEASSHKRASMHIVRGEDDLARHDPGGIEPLVASLAEFRESLLRENRTLKRALTDPRILSGIGNAHSDEILLFARLSPVRRTHQLDDQEIDRLYRTTQRSLREWSERLRSEAGDAFPDKVTAFHPEMAAHGKFGQPCPVCGSPIQRIVYSGRETNYCATCQTGGRLLADRALSRLLREDWPRTLEELEDLRSRY